MRFSVDVEFDASRFDHNARPIQLAAFCDA